MTLLQEAAHAITKAAGWKHATADAEGQFHFLLEGDLSMDLLSPDGKSILLYSDLGPLPSTESDEKIRDYAQNVAASCKKRLSIFSIENNRLALHRCIRFENQSTGEERRAVFPQEAKAFLNDLAWWKKRIANTAPATNTSFSFSNFNASWMIGR